jgi:hypothetical protein
VQLLEGWTQAPHRSLLIAQLFLSWAFAEEEYT